MDWSREKSEDTRSGKETITMVYVKAMRVLTGAGAEGLKRARADLRDMAGGELVCNIWGVRERKAPKTSL